VAQIKRGHAIAIDTGSHHLGYGEGGRIKFGLCE
jgi:hypothetical protein